MPVTTNTRKLAALLGASGAGIGTDGLMQSAGIDTDMATQAELDAIPVFDDNPIQANLAILAIRQAADHNDVKYSLQDRIIDDYYDASGIDATPSTNHGLSSGSFAGQGDAATGGTITTPTIGGQLYTMHAFTSTGNTNLVVAATTSMDVLVVAGGGGGGRHSGAGGGAGGLVWTTGLSVSAATHVMGVGGGGAQKTSDGQGNIGTDSTFGSLVTAKGGGGGGAGSSVNGGDGGSGGGGSRGSDQGTPGATIQSSQSGVSGSNGFGYIGGVGTFTGSGDPNYPGHGGGGAGGAGGAGTAAVASPVGQYGGAGKDMTVQLGTTYGVSGFFAGGGGGNSQNPGTPGGAGGSGGGGAGGPGSSSTGTAGTANTGGGGGGGYHIGGGGGAGGTGVIVIRYIRAVGNMTLQSTDTAAKTEADYADMVMLIEDSGGTPAVINTDIKGFISEDSGVTFTEGVLVDEGDWGTNKRILAFHDLDISAQSGTAMCYKITTHNQSASKETKIHATSIGWR